MGPPSCPRPEFRNILLDGVAPRAKMNQQRSRRFRTAQEAQEKEEARKESVAIWECVCHFLFYLSIVINIKHLCTAMGKTISEDEKNQKPWDSNAITPGTPFMELLAKSLRYWVVQKLNNDPGWKQVCYISYVPPLPRLLTSI